MPIEVQMVLYAYPLSYVAGEDDQAWCLLKAAGM